MLQDVDDEVEVEKAFHDAFGPYRINPRREFFEIESSQAIALLRLVAIEDVTPDVQKEAEKIDAESQAGARKLKSRRPNLNFVEMGIPLGSVLKFTQSDVSVEIVSENRVKYKEEVRALTAITTELLDSKYNVAPSPYWTFDGRSLRDIYNETYELG